MTLLFLIYSSHSNPAGCVVGGTQELTNALIRCIEHHGGEVRTGMSVRRILNQGGVAKGVELDDGRQLFAGKAVVAAIHPHDLGDMVAGLDAGLVERAKNVELSSYGIFLINAALREKPAWTVGKSPEDCLCVNYVDYTTEEDFRSVFDELKYGRPPSHFCGYTSVHTIYDPSRAPDGQHTLYFATFAPRELNPGGLEAWDDLKEARADWLMSRLQRYAPNISGDNILARHVDSPLDMARHSTSFKRGDVVGIAMFIYQFFGRRPTMELAQYRVPGAKGLYLSGPFMHPGGGLTGGGRATAIRILEDMDLRYSHIVSS